MNERELLKLCQEAFLATYTSADSRKLLKRLDAKPAAYAGSGQHILARHMADMIQKHFDQTRPDR